MANLKEKIGYALGDAAAGGITWKIMSIAFPLFFTNVFGLTFADAAMLMLIARMFDVVTDPLMGALADRTQSKWGTYRPWLIYGAIPFGLIFALLLYTPDFGPVGKRIWAYSLYLLMMACYTAVNVPYGSLLGVMTADDNEKNQFSSFRMVGAYAMGFITLLSFPYLQKIVGGTEQHQYAVLGIFFGVIAAAGTLACGLLTKERLKPVRAEKFSFKQFADLFRNKPWIYLTLIGICTNFFNGFRYAVAGYMFEYCLHGNVTMSGLIINYTVFMTFGELTCMIFGGVSPWFTKMIGSKKKAFMAAAAICTVFSVGFFFIPMDSAYIWVMVALVVLTSVGIGLYSPLLWSMYADVADYATEKNGTSSTGLIFSSGTMAQKFGTAISGSLVALFLGLAGASMITDDMGNTSVDPASITDSVLTMVWSLFSLIPAAIAVIMMLLVYKYPIKK
jgi:GPH family glycoside/pentoside/hexuronide:cation symporter